MKENIGIENELLNFKTKQDTMKNKKDKKKKNMYAVVMMKLLYTTREEKGLLMPMMWDFVVGLN
jgi:hypothetical protein